MAVRTITIGKGRTTPKVITRNYETLGEFVADVGVGLPAGPAAESKQWEVHCYNDDGLAIQETGAVNIGKLFWDGTANQSSTTYNCVVKPAPGTGANSHPNDHRSRPGPLDYDPAVGVAFEWPGRYDGLYERSGNNSRAPYIDFEGLQFLHSSIDFVRKLYERTRSIATTTEQCIFKVTPRVDRGEAAEWNGAVCWTGATDDEFVFKNNLIIISGDVDHVPGAGARGLNNAFFECQVFNNTIVNELHAIETDMTGASCNTSVLPSAVFTNNSVLGFDTAWDNNGDTDGTQEYTVTDASSANTDGSNNVTGITLTDQLESITLGSLNARLKSGSDAIGAAGGTYIATDDIFGDTRDAPEDVGCAEFSRLVGNGLIAGNKLQRGKLVQ